MKLSKILLGICLLCALLLMALVPAVNVIAQTAPTQTPAIVFVTATPAGGAAASGGAAPAGPTPTPSATEVVPREKQALRIAMAALSKKIGQKVGPFVKAWTWELLAFDDSALGCPESGQTVIKGFSPGYRLTITPIGSSTVYEVHVTYDLQKVYYCTQVGTTNAQALPAPVGGKAIGGVFEAGAQILDFNSNTIAKLNAAGLKWIKVQIAPSDNSGPGRIAAAHQYGFKILLSVKGQSGEVLNAGFFDQFATYVGSLAKSGADAIEIWNEENIDREWPNGQIDPVKYTDLLARSYNAIKGANGNTIVVSGALAPTGFAGSVGKSAAVWNDDVYYAGLAAAGAGKYMDCVGLHYNEGIVSPDSGSGDYRGSYPTYFFDSMLARAIGPFGGIPGCYTELGYLTPEGYGALPGSFAWAAKTTVANQAEWLARAAVKAAASKQVRLMIIFNMDFTFFGADPQAGYAMIRPGGSCPACNSLAAVLH